MAKKMHLQQKTKQKLIPKTIQCLQLLALPITSIEEFLLNAVTENPLLELDFKSDETTSLNESPDRSSDNIDLDYLDFPRRKYRKFDNDNTINLIDCLEGSEPEIETLSGFLQLQLALCNFSSVEKEIGLEIIGNINDNGYFVGNLQTIACYHGQTVSVVERVLQKLQTFYPLGIGGRNIAECLILQIDPRLPNYALIKEIIKYDLEDLAYRRFSKLAQKYKINKENFQQLLDYISTLNPKPGNIFDNDITFNYLVPDITIEKSYEGYSIYINGKTENVLRINQEYLLSFDKFLDEDSRTYLRQKYSEAQTLIECLEMRYNMLEKFAIFIIKEQSKFFKEGTNGLIPLTMQQAAQKIGVSVSTISRTVQGKYMQTSWGIFPLKYFFSGAFVSENERKISSTVIKDLISKMIASENPHCPLTDAKISEMLLEQGITISRRTVSKYRQALGFDGQRERRRYG